MKNSLNGLTQERLKQIVIYDPITGQFISKTDRGSRIKQGDILGSLKSNGYIYITIDWNRHLAHRLAFLYMEGYVPEMVDHIDCNKTNNSWSNLRAATRSQNGHNSFLRIDNTSGVKGVIYLKRENIYTGTVIKDGRRYRKKVSCSAWGKEKAKELVTKWVQETREKLHEEFTNHG